MQLIDLSKPDIKSHANLHAKSLPPLALTIGNFDGVHLGHQAILNQLKPLAKNQHLHTAVMFFEPQPKEFFASQQMGSSMPIRIYSHQEKVALLTKQGVDYAIVAEFNDVFRTQSAQTFACRLKQLNVRHIMVGDDFRFGQDRRGDSVFLSNAGFCVDKLSTVLLDEERISSTRIRSHLAKGNFELAAELLGRAYSITGVVEQGDQIGRTINFPTANVALNRPKPCLRGVYGAEVSLVNADGSVASLPKLDRSEQRGVAGFSEGTLFGAAHVGTRPAIKNKPPEWRLEVHLPNFSGDLYGKILKVTFLHFLHGEKDYDGLEALKVGIMHDIEQLLAWRKRADKPPFLTSA